MSDEPDHRSILDHIESDPDPHSDPSPATASRDGTPGRMDEDDERGDGDGRAVSGRGLGRTLALSDGIFAIAMTLLAFQTLPSDLKGDPAHHLTRALGGLGDRYFAFFLSFLVIGLLWLAHHQIFDRIEQADDVLLRLNLVFLMTVAALPFPSAVLGQYASQTAAVVLYSASMAVAGGLLCAITLLARRRELYLPGTTDRAVRGALLRSGSMAGVFTLSIPVALVSPSVAPYIWISLLPLRLFARARAGRSSQGRTYAA